MGTPTDLCLVRPNYNCPSNILRSDDGRENVVIGKDYNSGWIHGKHGIATLCDCPEPVDEGKDYVLNGKGTLTTGWTAAGGGTFSATGVFQYVISGGGNHAVYLQISGLTIGKSYNLTYTHKNGHTSAYIGPNTSSAAFLIILALGSKLLYTLCPNPIKRKESFLSFAFKTNFLTSPPLSLISSNISITA